MDPEQKRVLEETHALVRENHHLLRTIRRHQLIGTFWKFGVWLLFILVAYIGYFQYLKPLADSFKVTHTTASGPFGLPTSADIQKLINSFKANQ